jgi:alpha-1,3-rhamnosyl/mannosyltransferase
MVRALVDHVPALAPDLGFLLLRHPAAPSRLSDAENVTEVVVPHPANSPATMWFLPKAVDLSRVALFHATFNIMPAGLRMPCVTTIHDLMWLTSPEYCRARFWKPVEGWFYRHGINRALRKAAAIATVSQASASAVAAAAPEAASRLRVTLSGVSPDFRPVVPCADMLRRLGLCPDRRYVLTVGQNAPYKNHEGALAAFASAFACRSDIDLVLVQRLGKGGDRLLAQARALGIEARVKFLCRLTRDELIGLYGSASALLHPSFCEGFGNPLAEAMACGCPVVTSNCSAMPEVTRGAALTADPRDPVAMGECLRRVVDDPSLAAIMAARGQARAAQLSWRRFAEANLAIYRDLLGMAGPSLSLELDGQP